MRLEEIKIKGDELGGLFNELAEILNKRMLSAEDREREKIVQCSVLLAMAQGSRSRLHDKQKPGVDELVEKIYETFSPTFMRLGAEA